MSKSADVIANFLHGPGVRSGAHHCDYSGAHYMLRCAPSTPGVCSSVTKNPSTARAASLSVLSMASTSYTLHDPVATSAALALTTGWSVPSAPLPLTSTVVGGGAVAHTQTVAYLDSAGTRRSEVLTFTGAGAQTTVGHVAQVLSVTSNVDPQGTVSFTAAFPGPQDRYDGVLTILSGGVLGVSGGTLPT